MFKIIFQTTTQLKKDLKLIKNKYPKDQKKIDKVLDLMELDAFEQLDTKKLQPHSAQRYRIRVGHFRIICSIDHGNKIIIIHRIAPRKDLYR